MPKYDLEYNLESWADVLRGKKFQRYKFQYFVKQAQSQWFAVFLACTCRRGIRDNLLSKGSQSLWEKKNNNKNWVSVILLTLPD